MAAITISTLLSMHLVTNVTNVLRLQALELHKDTLSLPQKV